MFLNAYRLEDNRLKLYWEWNSHEESQGDYYGQDCHQMHIADLDGDGMDKVYWGLVLLITMEKAYGLQDLVIAIMLMLEKLIPNGEGFQFILSRRYYSGA